MKCRFRMRRRCTNSLIGLRSKIVMQISPDDKLWRHIHPHHYVWDKNENRWRVSSAAFDDGNDELSVDLGRLTSLQKSLENRPEHSLAEFDAKMPIGMGHQVKYDPKQPSNLAHSLVLGKISKANRRLLAKEADQNILVYGKNEKNEWIRGAGQCFINSV